METEIGIGNRSITAPHSPFTMPQAGSSRSSSSAVVLVVALITVLLWLNSRGRFMFTDCIVRNRGAIAEPWREFRTEGNRYFVFAIVITLCSFIVLSALALIFVLGWRLLGRPVVPLALLILHGVDLCSGRIARRLVMRFMVPVMYRQRCGAIAAFRAGLGRSSSPTRRSFFSSSSSTSCSTSRGR